MTDSSAAQSANSGDAKDKVAFLQEGIRQLRSQNVHMTKLWEDEKAEAKRLREALTRYGSHVSAGPDRCDWWDQDTSGFVHGTGVHACTCGFEEALS